ncbi:hypothetical protein [Halobaculum litoreum]|uniref:Uncharacterized protein n=1 Tax=Halobaculum litoreum TaxID=3031998 RepID=A0ABD5XUD9_9EURY|nr:hypothetical protein [Halobaculum sp. DT92]
MSDDDADAAEAGGINEAVAAFLAGADDVYDEYDKGYVDADAALSVLATRIDDLRAAAAGDDPAEGDGGE